MGAGDAAKVLRVEDLRVAFPSPNGLLPAVNGVTVEVAAGETVALVGESGCGKTMTALAILGLTPDAGRANTSGRVLFGDTDVRSLPRRQLRGLRGAGISMVFQEPVSSLNPVFTIGDQIAMAIRAHDTSIGKSGARERTRELLESVGIPDAAARLDDYPHEWSGGMCQRAMIAMAIANRPQLVIADEPTTALDVTVQARVLQLLRAAQEETGAAILMITHDLGVVAEMADRVVMMYAGRIVEEAPVRDLFDEPRHPYTRGLLASLPRLDGVGRLVSIPGQPPQLHSIPSGCAFHPRCDIAGGRAECASSLPVLETSGEGRRSACHFHEELAGAKAAAASAEDKSPRTFAGEAAEPILQIRDLVVHFPIPSRIAGRTIGHVQAVNGITLDLHPGRILGLVGESGCGKSTTANAVLRLVDGSGGSIVFDGQDLGDLSGRALRETRRGIQMVFQDPHASLNPKLTVGASIAEPLHIHGVPRAQARERVSSLLNMVGLDPSHADRYPHQFSGGQLQRVGIARALALEPRVLVLDEPVSALDVSIQAQVLNLLEDLQRQLGLAYMLIAHDLSVVRHVAHDVAVMYLGRIVEQGPTEVVFGQPRHPYTRALLDAVPVADPGARNGDCRIVLSGEVPSPANPPSGCHFRTRCWRAESDCAEVVPPLVADVSLGQSVACHFPEEQPLLASSTR